jgi:hypothetical protein
MFASVEFSSEILLAYIKLVVQLVDLGSSNNFNSNFPCQLLRNSSLGIKVRLSFVYLFVFATILKPHDQNVPGFGKQVNFHMTI